MANIYSTAAHDGYILSSSGVSNWDTVRDATDGISTGRTQTRGTQNIKASKTAGRGGGFLWQVYRSFLWFDTSGVSDTDDTEDITLYIYGFYNTTADLFAVKSTHSTSLVTADFDAITGWGGSGDQESNVTKYSSEVTSWNGTAYNAITLNAAARTDLENNDELKICLIESVHDLRAVEPGDGESFHTGHYYSDYGGTSRDPYVEYTPVAVAVTDNATFFGANF